MVPAASLAAGFLLLLPLRLGLLLEERLAVSNRDLIVIRMNLGEREKSMAIPAIVNEGGLKRRLHACDFSEIDITSQRPLARRLEVKLLDATASQDDHPGLLRMGGVDDHFVCHD